LIYSVLPICGKIENIGRSIILTAERFWVLAKAIKAREHSRHATLRILCGFHRTHTDFVRAWLTPEHGSGMGSCGFS
jgi:hypothetical protein